MSKFTYRCGTWEDGNILSDWQENENSDDYLERVGYSTIPTRFGHIDSSQIQIHESMKDHSYIALVTLGSGSCHEVYLPDFPSAMNFIKDHASGFSTDSINIVLENIGAVIDKLFQVQHGHPSHDICKQCDPVAWEKFQKLKERQKT